MRETPTVLAGRKWLWATAAVVLLATWAVFQSAGRGEFLMWDDDINITENPHVRGLTAENLRWMFTDTAYVRRYMPLGWLSWAAQYQFFGENSTAYHLVNVAMHSLSAVLLLLVLRRLLLLALPQHARQEKERAVLVCSGLAAVLWAIHPLRVEPVAWASGRLYCQALLLMLASLLAYLRHCELRGAGKRSLGWLCISVAAYAASLLTYPLALAYVALLPLLDMYPLRRFQVSRDGLRRAEARRALLEKIPYAAVVGLVLALTLWARSGASGLWRPPPTLAEFGVFPRLMQGFYVWASYLWRTIAPKDLSPVYTSLVNFDPLDGPFVASLLAVIGFSTLAIWKRRAWPGAAAAWASYLILLIPMLGLTEHPHYANDRYSYLPSLALAALAAGLLLHLWDRRTQRAAGLFTAGIAAVLCGISSASQIRAWHDTDTLLHHVIAKMGDSPWRADTLSRLGDRRMVQGRFEEAARFYAEAVGVAPRFLLAHQRLGDALLHQGRRQEALEVFEKALNVQPGSPDLHSRVADLLALTGRYDEAKRHYDAALRSQPTLGQAMNGLAWLLATCPAEGLRNGTQAVSLAETLANGTGHQFAAFEATLAAAYAEAGAFGPAVKAAERADGLAATSGDSNLVARCAELLRLTRLGSPFRDKPPGEQGSPPHEQRQ